MNKAWQDEVDFGHGSQRGGHARHPGANVSTLVRQKRGEPRGQSLIWSFLGKGEAGRVDSLRLASLNNSGGLWAIGVVSAWTRLGPWSQSDLGQGKF